MGSGTSKDNAVDKFEISDEEERGNSWGNKNSEKKEQKTEVSVLGKVFGKPKTKPTTNLIKARTIVDLSSSDSEDEYFKHKTSNEDELRDDINSLEKTLSSLGLEKRVRQVRVNESRESRPPAYSSDSDRGYLTSSSAAMGPGGQKKQFRRRKDLRFSWDDKMSERQQEEWTVQKVRFGVKLGLFALCASGLSGIKPMQQGTVIK